MQSAISDEAKRILDEAKGRGIILRLFGGVAVKYHCPSATHRSLQRSYPDLDFFGRGKQGREIRKLFLDLGYEPNQRFNALHGVTRLIFEDAKNQRVVDIFLDVFRMCHTLHLGDRLSLDDYTIPISDLLLTKLQVVEINEKDIRDLIVILKDHDVGVQTVMEFDNIETVKRAVEIDAGISIVPLGTIGQEVAKQTLAAVQFDDAQFFRQLAAIYKKNKVLSPAMKQFLAILKEAQ